MTQEEFGDDEVLSLLEACVAFGLVEVNGITEKGEWLYGATDKGREFAYSNESPEALFDMIRGSQEEDD
jgi:hypothetical protein